MPHCAHCDSPHLRAVEGVSFTGVCGEDGGRETESCDGWNCINCGFIAEDVVEAGEEPVWTFGLPQDRDVPDTGKQRERAA